MPLFPLLYPALDTLSWRVFLPEKTTNVYVLTCEESVKMKKNMGLLVSLLSMSISIHGADNTPQVVKRAQAVAQELSVYNRNPHKVTYCVGFEEIVDQCTTRTRYTQLKPFNTVNIARFKETPTNVDRSVKIKHLRSISYRPETDDTVAPTRINTYLLYTLTYINPNTLQKTPIKRFIFYIDDMHNHPMQTFVDAEERPVYRKKEDPALPRSQSWDNLSTFATLTGKN